MEEKKKKVGKYSFLKNETYRSRCKQVLFDEEGSMMVLFPINMPRK